MATLNDLWQLAELTGAGAQSELYRVKTNLPGSTQSVGGAGAGTQGPAGHYWNGQEWVPYGTFAAKNEGSTVPFADIGTSGVDEVNPFNLSTKDNYDPTLPEGQLKPGAVDTSKSDLSTSGSHEEAVERLVTAAAQKSLDLKKANYAKQRQYAQEQISSFRRAQRFAKQEAARQLSSLSIPGLSDSDLLSGLSENNIQQISSTAMSTKSIQNSLNRYNEMKATLSLGSVKSLASLI